MATYDVGGRRIAYDDSGSGDAVVLVHGMLMNRSMWEHQASSLSDSWRIVTVDAPGHGESDPAAIGYNFEAYAADIWKLCDALGISGAVFGGQSMGGFTSIRCALQRPDHTRGLILVDTSARAENPEMLPQYEAFLQVALDQGVTEDLAGIILAILFSGTFAGTPRGEEWKKKLMSIDPKAAHAMIRAVYDRPSILDLLGTVRCPAVVIHGEDDIAIPMERGQELSSILKAPLVRVPGAGHATPVESPNLVTKAIRGFLENLGAAG